MANSKIDFEIIFNAIFWGLVILGGIYWYTSQAPVESDSSSSYSSTSSVTTSGAGSSASYKGYRCTQDCSGHTAGYDWAEEHGIDDPDDCSGNSNSFIEGCESYAEEQQGSYSRYDGDEYDEYDQDDGYGDYGGYYDE